jgi:hypothetical protein
MIDVPQPTLNAAFGLLEMSLHEGSFHRTSLPISDGKRATFFWIEPATEARSP